MTDSEAMPKMPADIGVMPKEWPVSRIGDLFEIQQGKALSPRARQGVSPKPFLRTSNVLWGRIDLSAIDEMDFSVTEAARLALQPGDLLVCEGGDVGRSAVWSGELASCFYQNHIHRLRKRRDDVESWFFMFWMQAAFTIFGLYGGQANRTTIPNLSKTRLSNFPVPHPSLPEQRAIVAVLSAVRGAIKATEAAIDAAKGLKKSLMRYLFTFGPVSFDSADDAALKETDVGLIPNDWETLPVSEVVALMQYGANNRAKPEGTYPILRMNNLTDGRIDISNLKYVDLDAQSAQRFKLEPGDLLFNRTNSPDLVGKTSLFELPGHFVFASYLIRVRCNNEWANPRFLNAYMNWDETQARLRMLATRGVGQSNISASKLRGLLICLPPADIQSVIAGVLHTVDRKIGAETNRREGLDILFKSLLRDLMAGRIRVDAGSM